MYNVELYIEKCLLSCLTQDISPSEYEIIVVNDGSPDNSLKIVEEIADKTFNIFIISQPNGGLSVARNTGLQHAKGEYVWFVDSDDWIEENCLSKIVDCLNRAHPDFLQLQFRYAHDDSSLNKDSYCIINGVVSGMQQANNGGVPHPAQFAIYRRDFLLSNGLNFFPGIYHEDSEFKPRALFLAERCASYDKVVYNYYQRSTGSIMSTPNPKRAYDYLKGALSINDFYNQVAAGGCESFFHNHISLMINNALSQVGNEEMGFSLELYRRRYIFMHLRKSSVLKYKLEGLLFTIFPRKTVSIYRILQNLNR